MRLRVLVINRKKTVYDLSEAICSPITYTTVRVGTASTITFDVLKSGEMSFHEGDMVKIFLDKKLYIVCYIFKKTKKQDVISVKAYDLLRYMQYKESYNFTKKSADKIITIMANEFKLPIGELANTGFILPDKLYEDKTLLDIATDALMQTTVKTGKVFNLFDDVGKLALKESGTMLQKEIIGNRSFATDYTYETSIENSYSYIKLVKPNKKTGKGDSYIAYDQEKIDTWGRLQFYKKVEEGINDVQIRELAKNYLKYYAQTQRNLKIDAIGIPSFRAGCMVAVDIKSLGDIDLKKMLLIYKCTHKLSEYDHTMTLEMRVTND